jgi:hypothetical protein
VSTSNGIRVAAIVATLLALTVGPALGGKPSKPPPPQSGKSIYYVRSGYGGYKMASDGSGKTSLAGQVGFAMSDVRYDGSSYYMADAVGCGATPEGDTRNRLVVAPVETSGTTIELLNDSNWNPLYPAFRPGTTPRVTFVAVVWDSAGTATAGLYEIAFSIDGSTIGDPVLLLESGTSVVNSLTYPKVSMHDWLDEYTIVYGDGYSGTTSQLYLGDIDDPKTSHTALIADGKPRMVWGVQFNSNGSKVLYANYDGVYEISTGGNATPVVWVARTSVAFAMDIHYLDDSTLVYTWWDSKKWTEDIYRKPLGGGSTNLTGDVTEMCEARAAR